MQQGPLYFDPFTGTEVNQDGTAVAGEPLSFNDLFAGQFSVRGTNFVDLETGASRQLGQAGPFSFEQVSPNKYQLVSQIQRSQVNRPIHSEGLRMVSGTVNVVIGGEETALTIAPIPLARVNHQWVYDPSKTGPDQYYTIEAPLNNNADVAQIIGEGARLATPTESMYAAVMRQLLVDNETLLEQYAAEHGIVGDERRTAAYNAVGLLIKEGGISNLQSFTGYLVE